MVKRTRRSRLRGGVDEDVLHDVRNAQAQRGQYQNVDLLGYRHLVPGVCYEGVEWNDRNNGQPTYFGMYANEQPEPEQAERANAGGGDMRGWFINENGVSIRRHYMRDTIRNVPCRNPNAAPAAAVDGAMDVEGGRRRRSRKRNRRIKKVRV